MQGGRTIFKWKHHCVGGDGSACECKLTKNSPSIRVQGEETRLCLQAVNREFTTSQAAESRKNRWKKMCMGFEQFLEWCHHLASEGKSQSAGASACGKTDTNDTRKDTQNPPKPPKLGWRESKDCKSPRTNT